VNAAGTVYASVAGDLTTKVTSISNQSQATGTITAGLATVPDPLERDKLIAWVRGADNKDDENRNGSTSDIRASVHGDVLHSRPAVINYNRSAGNNDVYVFYGANDGMFHAVKGGQTSDGGNEQWGFVALEHFGKLKRLRDQTPVISSAYPKGYFFDGPIGVYTLDANSDSQLTAGGSGDKVYLYTAMRRGGRMIYAFDVTDPTTPRLLWKKGCTQATGTGTTGGCDTGWDMIGQTWSQPQVVYLRAYPTTPVLIFGAGYDSAAEDFQPCYVTAYSSTSVTGKTGLVPPTPMSAANCPPTGGGSSTQSRTMGQGVFIVNALTGAVLWRAGPDASANMVVTGMNYSITADLAIMRNRTNTAARTTTPGIENVPTGFMDRIYAPDTGGNVWRIDVADAAPGNWTVTKLAALSVSSASSSSTGSPAAVDMRKFEFQPDVVYSSNPTTGQLYDAVLLGSGDREHPFDMVVNNRFYMVRDINTGTITPAMVASASPPVTVGESDLYDITNGCLQQASLCPGGTTQASAAAALDAAKGWKFLFAPTNVGEKTVSSATTAASTVIFNTNQPKQDTVTGTTTNVGSNASNQCTSDLGTARQYGLNFQNGNSQNIFNTLPTQYVPTAGLGRYATFAGGGFLPTPVPVVVQIGGKYYQTVIAGVQTTNPGGLKLQSRLRTYWYRKTD
jgi:type IV pilus assembly protein PilY1